MSQQKMRLLGIINTEPNLQNRLGLLAKHGFLEEASRLVRETCASQTAFFHYDQNKLAHFCHPLSEIDADTEDGIYVVCQPSSKLVFESLERSDQSLVFTLGWLVKVLGWIDEEVQWLVVRILAEALARPLNQWTLNQAEGTARVARQLLSAYSTMILIPEIAALHLVFHLRSGDFLEIHRYLYEIPDFPVSLRESTDKGTMAHDLGLVNWITNRLLILGWSKDRIRKELVEWIWLKTSIWSRSLLAIAKADVFDDDDEVRAAAIKHWLFQRFDRLVISNSEYSHPDIRVSIYSEIMSMARLTDFDVEIVVRKLVAIAATGQASSVDWFINAIGGPMLKFMRGSIFNAASRDAANAGNHGLAVALAKYCGGTPNPEWIKIAKVRELATDRLQ